MADPKHTPQSLGEPLERGLAEAFGAPGGLAPGHAGAAAAGTAPRSMGSILRTLQERAESSLLGVHLDDHDGNAPVITVTEETRKLRDPSGRYQVLGEIGRGGVGIVFKGRDQDLGRDVAMKVLRDDYSHHPELLARFVEEAQIGGQLQHPGIVPVYELGMQAGERPYFAMKLVKGETLAAQLARRADPAEDRRRLLGVFEQVCQTVAYAHSRHVVHRDLKPANVMIGAFGEVQVVDWGFAKVLARGGVADEVAGTRNSQVSTADRSVIETVRSKPGSVSHSVAGSMLGTPAYMSPEQARGDIEALDERSDVFGLGAILCELLTGAPPYRLQDGDLIRQAAEGELNGAYERMRTSGADAVLVDLATSCLARAARARPQSAAEVAQRVGAYLTSVEERARDAELSAAQARWRQRLTLVVALGGLLLLLFGATAWFWRQRDVQQRRVELLERIGAARAAASGALTKAQASGLDERLWESAIAGAEELVELTRIDLAGPALREDAEAQLALASSQGLAAGLERDRLARDRVMLERLAALLRPPEHPELESSEVKVKRDLDRGYLQAFEEYCGALSFTEASVGDLLATLQRGDIHLELATTLDYWATVRDGIVAREAAAMAGLIPGDLGPDEPEQVAPIDAALTARLRRLATNLDPDSASRSRLRDLLDDPELDRARLVEFAVAADVADLTADGCRVLALALWRIDERDRAIEVIQRAQARFPGDFDLYLQGAQYLERADEPRLQEQLDSLRVARALQPLNAEVQHRQGMALSALERHDEALGIYRELMRTQPAQLGHWHAHIGRVLLSRGDELAAVAELRRALELSPFDELALSDLGLLLSRGEELEEAEELLRRCIERFPRNAEAHNHLGNVLDRTGRRSEALECYRRASRLDPRLAFGLLNEANLARVSGDLEGELALVRQAYERAPRVFETADAWMLALLRRHRFAEAIPYIEDALRRRPDEPRAVAAMGLALRELGRLDEALPFLERAVELEPENPLTHFNLGRLRALRDDGPGAIECMSTAVAVDPACEEAQLGLFNLQRHAGRTAEALAVGRAALEHLPEQAVLLEWVALTLKEQGALGEAIPLARRLVDLAPESGNALNLLAICVESAGRVEEARQLLVTAQRVAPEVAVTHYNRGRILMMQGDMRGAIAAFEEAAGLYGPEVESAGQPMAERALKLAARCADLLGDAEAMIRGRADVPLSHARFLAAVRLGEQDGLLDEVLDLARRTLNLEPRWMSDEVCAAPACVARCAARRIARSPDQAGGGDEPSRLARGALEVLLRSHAAPSNRSGPAVLALGHELAATLADRRLDLFRGDAGQRLSPDEIAAWDELWGRIKAATLD